MRNWKYAALAAVATLLACGEPAYKSPVEEKAPPVLYPIASFTADITPPSPGPGGDGARAVWDGTKGSNVWTTTVPATGGGIAFNPARSIQLRSTANFAVQPGPSGACTAATSTIFAPVEITNFFPERLVTLYVAFSWMNPSSHALCANDPAPSGVMFDDELSPGPTFGFGNVQYTAGFESLTYSNQTPDAACTGCVVAGGAATRDWRFDYSTTGAFTVAGQVYAELSPQPPSIRAPAAPSLLFGAHEQLPFRFFVYSTKDSETFAFVNQLKVELCPGTSAGCTTPGSEVLYVLNRDGPHNASAHRDDFEITAADLLAPPNSGPALVPGTEYFMRTWASWDVDGTGDSPGGPGGMVDATVATETSFTLVGTVTPLTPADGAGFGEGDRIQWSIDTPDPGRDTPQEWFYPGSFQICADNTTLPTQRNCNTPLFLPITPLNAHRFITASTAGSVYTYTFLPDYAQWSEVANGQTNIFPRPVPGTVGYWRVHNQYSDGSDRASPWSAARKIVFGAKPTNMAGSATLTFDLDDRNATDVQVQLCADADTTCAAGDPPASATLAGSDAYTFDASGTPTPFRWRARAVYAGGDGPWSAIVSSAARVFVFEGDSLTSSSVTPGQEWPTQAMNMSYFSGGTSHNVADSGDKIAHLNARYAAAVRPHCLAPGGADLFVWVGTNDFDTAQGGGIPATVFAAVQAYWQQAKTDGCRVVAFTLYRNAADPDADVDAFNALVRASPVWDVLVEPDLFMGLNRNPTYLHTDFIHPSVAGDTAIAVNVNATMFAAH